MESFKLALNLTVIQDSGTNSCKLWLRVDDEGRSSCAWPPSSSSASPPSSTSASSPSISGACAWSSSRSARDRAPGPHARPLRRAPSRTLPSSSGAPPPSSSGASPPPSSRVGLQGQAERGVALGGRADRLHAAGYGRRPAGAWMRAPELVTSCLIESKDRFVMI